MSAFKAYDIRGIYNEDFNKDTAYRIGYFLPCLFGAVEIAVCRDFRESSDEIRDFLIKGILDSGCSVVDYGHTTTPMSYYISQKKGYLTTVMITASHNPASHNGFKISGPGAVPVGKESGLGKLEALVLSSNACEEKKGGALRTESILDEYIAYINSKKADYASLSLVVDCSSGAASLAAREIFGDKAIYMLDEPDGKFSVHNPNPLDASSRKMLVAGVKKAKADAGIIFDGDADRVMFIDNKGRFISPDLIINFLAYSLIKNDGDKVVIDIRSSKSCVKYIKALGGTPIIWKVGHVFAKAKLKEEGAVFGGELAGHYYFSEFGNCDDGFLAAVYVLNMLCEFKEDGTRLSDLLDEFTMLSHSGEINFEVKDKEKIIGRLNEIYGKSDFLAFYDFDGIRYDFSDWWFNVRPSNTEPYLRLVLEADTKELMEQKLSELEKIIHE